MMKTLGQLVERIDEPNRSGCYAMMREHYDRLAKAWGSSHNHQAWEGGYLDHAQQVMNLALDLYGPLAQYQFLPFSVEDALIVLFLHDLEKPWKDETKDMSKVDKRLFAIKTYASFGITLTPEQDNAFWYVEGEGDDYKNDHRVMNELAAFCHMCDVASARIFHSLGAPASLASAGTIG